MAYIRGRGYLSSFTLGRKGEEIAWNFLIKMGFQLVCANYQKPWGEIDIIATKDNILHFFEVKSVTYGLYEEHGGHKPEENVNRMKLRHIRRMIETYLFENSVSPEMEFSFHVICVYMDMVNRKARIKWLRDIIL